MLFIVATYREGSKIIALKLYDSSDGTLGMFHTDQILSTVKSNRTEIAGVTEKEDASGTKKTVLSQKLYNVRLLDKVDSAGNPLDDNNIRVPIIAEGFGTNTKITLVNSLGQTEIVSYEDFIQLLKEHKVTGAQRHKGGIRFNKGCILKGIKC